MAQLQLSILDINGKKAGSIDLSEETFGGHVNQDVIHQAVTMYRASFRQGNVSTKVQHEVSGGGKKPWKQKGTGRARSGSNRSPLWHGGGITFGPKPRDFSYNIPQKVKIAAVRESLKAKYQGETLLCLEDISQGFKKTKEFAVVLTKIGLQRGRTLAILDGSDESVLRVSRNIARFNMVRASDVNAYDIMSNKNILVTKTAFEKILERISGSVGAPVAKEAKGSSK